MLRWLALLAVAWMLMPLDLGRAQVYSLSNSEAAACGSCGQQELYCACVPTWTRHVSAELLWLDRTQADSQVFIVDQQDLLVPIALIAADANELYFNIEAGVRGTIGVEHASGHGGELRYSGIYDQGASLITVGTNPAVGTNLFPWMFNDTDTLMMNTGVTSITTQLNSGLHSGEINWIGRPWGRFRPIAGARWIRFTEDWDVYETALITTGLSAGIGNNMYGGQIGFDVCLWDRSHWFRIDARFTSTILNNSMSLDANRHTATTIVDSFSARSNDLAYGGQLDLTARWQPVPCFAFMIGYTGLWLENIALVTDQSDDFTLATGAGTFDTNGISYQGGHVALELRW